MSEREIQFVSALMAGPVAPVSIGLARTTRKRIMRKLEERGLTMRIDGKWKLTKAGWHYAIAELGMPLTAPAYELPDIREDEDVADIIATIQEAAERVQQGESSMLWIIERSKEFAAWVIGPITIGLSIAAAMTATFRVTGYWSW